MNVEIAAKLTAAAHQLAEDWSRDRDYNEGGKWQYSLQRIVPTSESTASIWLRRQDNDLLYVHMFYVRARGGCWLYMPATDSHVLGAQHILEHYQWTQSQNWKNKYQ